MIGQQTGAGDLHYRQGKFPGQRTQGLNGARAGPHFTGDDQGVLGLRDHLGGLLNDLVRRHHRGVAQGPWPRRHPVLADQTAQDFARQRQVHRPAGFRHGDIKGAADDFLDRLPGAEFIVPFDIFPEHAALVKVLLAPVDTVVARADVTGFGQRRASGHH